MDSSTAFVMHPNKQWFDTDEQANLDNFADPDTAMFLVRRHGRFQVKLPVNHEVIVGRCHTGKGPQPQVDLSPYNAAECGTSRLHAVLRHDAHGWWLEDMQSSNGTWVNGKELQPYDPVHLDVRNQVVLGTLTLSILLPHKVFSGVVMPVNVAQTTPTHVVNIEGDVGLQNLLRVTFQAAEPAINLHPFTSGDEALPYIAATTQSIDLFILDITLPGTLNGLELAARIRSLGCPGAIIIASADASPGDEILASLKSEFLPKPSHILEIAPRLFNYHLKAAQTHATERSIEPDNFPTVENGPLAVAATPLPGAPDMQTIPAVAMAPGAGGTLLSDETNLLRPDRDEKIRLDNAQKPGGIQVPLSYLQRIITRIRRL